MFTGIIKEVGKIKRITGRNKSIEIEVSCSPEILRNIFTGDSISVNGCCLTVKAYTKNSFKSDISFSTLETTTFKNIGMGERVNLEDSLKYSDKLSGHLVAGHVDTTTEILKIEKISNSYRFDIKTPEKYLPYLAPKGSVALDGISLTIQDLDEKKFGIAVIAHTFENTNLMFKKPKDLLNLEIDLIARYIRQILKFEDIKNLKNENIDRDKILREKLAEHGFLQ
ncbi:MAG: riboflavin synthase [Actinobacteria bacterium]|nr:riboflavin synthase [Actinomycetota bacterium]MBM3711980.1 riboflavin synthase [Actinomycetota bacterium]